MAFPFNSVNDLYNSLHWILVLHNPDDVITISSSSYPDTDLNDDFVQPQTE